MLPFATEDSLLPVEQLNYCFISVVFSNLFFVWHVLTESQRKWTWPACRVLPVLGRLFTWCCLPQSAVWVGIAKTVVNHICYVCFIMVMMIIIVISSHLGFVHPLQDVALHQCLPSSSVCCLPNTGGSLLLCYVILPSSAWSSSRSLPSPWLPLCASPCPPIIV